MRSDSEGVHAYAATLLAWMQRDLRRRMPGGRDGHDFLRRYDAAIRGIAGEHSPDDTVVVFGHGAAIRVYTALRAGLDADSAAELRIMNTGLGLLEGHPDSGWDLVRWQSEPLGGAELADGQAHDVTGESAENAVTEDRSLR